MAQHDFVISDQTFPATRSDLNNALQALASTSQGATAPSTTYAYQFWLDSNATPWLLKMRNAADDAWIEIMRIDDSDDTASIDAANVDILDTAGHFVGTQLEAAMAELGPFTVPSIVAGDTFYGSASDTVARLAKGSDGEVFTLASGIPSWAATATITRETAITTSSGTAHGFTSIAAGADIIIFMMDEVQLSSTDELIIELGDSGGYESAGYRGGVGDDGSSTTSTAGALINRNSTATNLWSGEITFVRLDGNTWAWSGGLTADDNNRVVNSSGRKTLTAELDRIQITRTGSDTFGAGKVNIMVQ